MWTVDRLVKQDSGTCSYLVCQGLPSWSIPPWQRRWGGIQRYSTAMHLTQVCMCVYVHVCGCHWACPV